MFQTGTRASCRTFDVFIRNSDDQNSRFAVVVPKHGNTIVERNRLKRRVREILRTQWLPAETRRPVSRDLLVRVKPRAYGREFAELASDLGKCLELERC